ncbi:MAG: caspase family protein [Calditrichae bacterium]|nr:caspase family protein [Calditrichia bacterium]
MAGKLYALLVGISDYRPDIGKLSGCVNDVNQFEKYLEDNFKKETRRILTLRDSEATYANIITSFRTHFKDVTKDDVVVFKYAGHGAQWKSAKAFYEYFPDGMDEGLVCYDSRQEGGVFPYDLADKELAVLIDEIAKKEPHIAVILDCCHSGSGTRDVNSFKRLTPRQTHQVDSQRPLDSYIDGYYAKLHKSGAALKIPTSRHILLAACERRQKAWEGLDKRGVFSNTLEEVLEKSGNDITYADLFTRSRLAVRQFADNQDPQFETYGGFNAFDGFLGSQATKKARSFMVYFDSKSNKWWAECGAADGLPTESDKSVELVIYDQDDKTKKVGTANTVEVGVQKSIIDFDGDTSLGYQAEPTTLPIPPLPVYLEGDDTAAVEAALKKSSATVNFEFVKAPHKPDGLLYSLVASKGKYELKQRETGQLIQWADKDSLELLFPVINHVSRWERLLKLQNHDTSIDKNVVDFAVHEYEDAACQKEIHVYRDDDVILEYTGDGNDQKDDVHIKLKASNGTSKERYFALFQFCGEGGVFDYGIRAVVNQAIANAQEFTLGESWDLYLDADENDMTYVFKLFVSDQPIEDYVLVQQELKIGSKVGSHRGGNRRAQQNMKQNDWFARTITLKVARRIDQVGAKDTSISNGKIKIKAHKGMTANLSMAAAKAPTRSVGVNPTITQVMENQGLEMCNFTPGTRAAGNESVLEITDIQNEASLKEQPLEIEIGDLGLQEDEYVLPLTIDAEGHVVLGGDTWKDENGHTQISIDHIIPAPDQRRSLGKAMKLYFFKTYLKQNPNQLSWVEYKDDDSVMRHHDPAAVAAKVKKAKNIILLVHGIIGDTEVIAQGLRLAKDAQGKSLDQKFDLVLTYDYENLHQPIPDTADDLKTQLQAAGFGENDGKRLTMLVHSMGGLVSRSFIEQQGGNRMVDHLVMCGTPNNGSPFGKIDKARKLFGIMTTLMANYFPALLPVSGVVGFLLKRSEKITQTLQMMDPDSDFITSLNRSGDPGIPYTILAGELDKYEEPSDKLFTKLLDKAGKGAIFKALFGTNSHDIAVRVDSILGVNGSRKPAPVTAKVPCHHLNYFISEPGLSELMKVKW